MTSIFSQIEHLNSLSKLSTCSQDHDASEDVRYLIFIWTNFSSSIILPASLKLESQRIFSEAYKNQTLNSFPVISAVKLFFKGPVLN